jgi:hemoglobin
MRKSPYLMIGGEAGVEQLVKTFYDIVESDPMAASLMAMHNRGHGLAHASQAQFEFLSGFLGGPQLYLERHRHSNVRRMHAYSWATSAAWPKRCAPGPEAMEGKGV